MFRLGLVSLALVMLGACATGGQRVVPVRSASSGMISADAAAFLQRGSFLRSADIDPARMVGLDGVALERLLGEPALVRRDAPAEIWQYRGADCVLDLFLYREAGGQEASGQKEGRPRVLYLEARTGAAEPAPTEGCIGSLLTTKRKLQSS
ncbi:hypothetical protein [Rhodospirillaceae bacterium SYSU D60014]|uniref:hypothetical protein n=1 Tax=Virgifigura deserti TaxID=2268457 RepID=UPI000E664D09